MRRAEAARLRPTSWLLLAVAGLLHLGLLIGWRWQLPLVPYFFDATVLSGGRGLDFYSIYQAGYNARQGRDIYEGDPNRVEVVVPYFTPYRYLPPVAYTVGAALSLFSPLTAYKIWVVTLELVLLACVGLTYWLARPRLDLFARLAAMWLVFTPYYLELFMGQFSLVQAALVFGMLILPLGPSATSPNHQLPPTNYPLLSVLWIISLLWKINTLLLAPVFAVLRRWPALLAAAALVAATTLPYFMVFPAHWRDFVGNNFGLAVDRHELGNLGLRQLVFEALAAAQAGPGVQRAAQWAVIGAVLVAASAATLPAWRAGAGRLAPVRVVRLLCLWWVAFFLVSPQVWEHHYVMLLPVLVTAYYCRPGWPIALLWLLLALPTPFGFIGLQPLIAANHDLRAFRLEPAWQPLLQHASKALPALALFVYCFWPTRHPQPGISGEAIRTPRESSLTPG